MASSVDSSADFDTLTAVTSEVVVGSSSVVASCFMSVAASVVRIARLMFVPSGASLSDDSPAPDVLDAVDKAVEETKTVDRASELV